MKTEAEARKCWCPFARNTNCDPGVPAFNQVEHMPMTNCIASECMAWRWYYDEDRVERGFCGLAGSTGIQRNSNP